MSKTPEMWLSARKLWSSIVNISHRGRHIGRCRRAPRGHLAGAMESIVQATIWMVVNLAAICPALSPHPIVVLITFDRIPNEYLKWGHSPFLQQLASTSTTTEWMLHQFPQRTLPNLHSIATGLYPDVHGVLGDLVVVNGTYECIGYGEKMYRQRDVTPIWTLNQMSGSGRYSGVVAWPGAEFGYRVKKRPTFQIQLTDCKTWEQQVEEVMEWLTDDRTPANLVLLNFKTGRNRSSETVAQVMQRVDRLVQFYFEQLSHYAIGDRVNTIVLSDHTLTYESAGVMPDCTTQLVQNDTSCRAAILKLLRQASLQLNTFKGVQYAKLKNNFQGAEISKKASQYLQVQQDRIFEQPTKLLKTLGRDKRSSRTYPLFIANGPLFQSNFVAAPFENTDIYALISHILNLTEPLIPINGSLDGIKDILKVKSHPEFENKAFDVVLFFIIGLLILASAWFIFRMRKQERSRLL